MHASPAPETVDLWRRVRWCQEFPAYRLDDLDELDVGEVAAVFQMLATQQQLRQAS
jgi:hypothetical protein